ncbi:hypothetical protein [Marivita sp.]|uniref:hypothetical protein n=1 Tax=Marivita sp. TaxID=2003365 RepID=UPI003F6AA0A2
MSTTTDTLDQAKDRATEMANDAKEYAKASAKEQAESARSQAIDEIDDTAEATHAARDEFDTNSLQAAALDHLGAQISSVAATLRDKPVDVMADDVAVFARKNPMLFLGGAAVVGFAAARFLKSGNTAQNSDSAADDPWSGHLNYAEPQK